MEKKQAAFLPPKDILPEGWLKKQLEIQAEGLAGNLDKVWPDVRDSKWFGGDRDGWERVPYFLDGFIPLAHLLRREDLIARADGYIEKILDRQRPDGWICPQDENDGETSDGYDLWAVFLISKVLLQDILWTGRERSAEGLYRCMKFMWRALSSGRLVLFRWGKFRFFEAMLPLRWLRDRYGEPWITKLAHLIAKQGADYTDFMPLWERPLDVWTYETHIVNLSMLPKEDAVCRGIARLPAGHAKPKTLLRALDRKNATAVGTISGDECLSGDAPNRGTELCAVVELMDSLAWAYLDEDDPTYADRLEKVAFNALPATLSDDMWSHQYDQQVNQIACRRLPGRSFFRTNGVESNLFGLEPNYGCCTANFGQGWPKLALHILTKRENELTLALLLPCRAETGLPAGKVSLRVETEYPFRNRAKLTLRAEKPGTTLRVRIPGSADGYTLTVGETVLSEGEGGYVTIDCPTKEAVFELELRRSPKMVKHTHIMPLYTAEYGPLVFALPIETEWKKREFVRSGVERKFPYCDYELIPHSDWNYGFAEGSLTVEELPGDEVPFSSVAPRLAMKANLAPVRWELADGQEFIVAAYPESRRAIGEPTEKTLVPYGGAKLRMTEMPLVIPKK